MPHLAKYKECTGCMVCVDSCNHNALNVSLNKEGHIVPLIDESKCVRCYQCIKVCPVKEEI